MRLLETLVVAATSLSVFARPLTLTRKGEDNSNNILVMKFAGVLEQLENEFYKQGIQKFSDQDFQNAGFSSTAIVADQLGTIQKDEQSHLDFLSKALAAFGESVPDNCQFNFDSALTDVPTMAAVARVVEMTGVAAYAGAASLITDPQILTAAATILTTEARHQTILNIMSGAGSPIPQPFDMALTPGEVLAVASPFISGCDLGVPPNKPLKITNDGVPTIGTLLTFDFDGKDGQDNLHCQMLVGGVVNAISLPIDKCIVPEGIDGPVALFITSDQQPLANNAVLRQSANNVVAGPNFAFIDPNPNPLSQLIRAGAASGGDSGNGGDGESDSGSGPNFSTGSEAAGAVIVDGWTNLPDGQQPPSSNDNGSQDGQGDQSQDDQGDQSQDDQNQDGQNDQNQDGDSQSQDDQNQDGEQPPSDPNAPSDTGAVIVSES